MDLDRIDQSLLRELQNDARATLQALGDVVDLTPPGVQKRVQRLEQAGVIQGYTTRVDRQSLGLDLLCFVQVNLRHHSVETVRRFREAVQRMPEVLECHHLTGETDYLLKIVVRNREHLEQFIVNTLTPSPGVDRIRTSLVLSEIKHTAMLPVDLGAARDGGRQNGGRSDGRRQTVRGSTRKRRAA